LSIISFKIKKFSILIYNYMSLHERKKDMITQEINKDEKV